MSPEHKKTNKFEVPNQVHEVSERIEESETQKIHRKLDSCILGINRLSIAVIGDDTLGVDGVIGDVKKLKEHRNHVNKKIWMGTGAFASIVFCKDWIVDLIKHGLNK